MFRHHQILYKQVMSSANNCTINKSYSPSVNGINLRYWKSYLIYFAGEHVDFQVQEIKSISKIFNIPYWIDEDACHKECPFLQILLPSDEFARRLMSRSVLSKSVYELWASTPSYADMCHTLEHELAPDLSSKYRCVDDISMTVLSHGRAISKRESVAIIEHVFDLIPLTGRINLNNPRYKFTLVRYYLPRDAADSPPQEQSVHFGRWLCDGARRHLLHEYSLSTRAHIGNTSMDPCLAFTMCNQALVGPGHLVYDPFCGTGSLLVSAAHHKAYVMGTDIDYCLLHGLSKPSRPGQARRQQGEGIRLNLKQYNLEEYYVDVIISDTSHNIWRHEDDGSDRHRPGIQFDAIITDPPYGVRERSIKVGSQKETIPARDPEAPHYPEKVGYGLREMLSDLLTLAARYLRVGGRLVYWLPVDREAYRTAAASPATTFIPRHACLTVLGNSEQVLSAHTSRRLITMEKCRHMGDLPEADANKDVEVEDYVSAFRKLYFMPKLP